MRGYQTAAIVANAVRMLRAQHPSAPFLLVEGDTDVRLWRHFVVAPCVILDAGGRANAEGALAVLTSSPDAAPVAAIVDADFDRLEGRAPAHPGLFWTDGHDVEVMMLATPALAAVLRERAVEARVASFTGVAGEEGTAPPTPGLNEEQRVDRVRHALFLRARALGALRLHNHRATLNLDFKRLQLKQVCDVKLWTMNVPELLRLLAAHNARPGVTSEALGACSHRAKSRRTVGVMARSPSQHDPLGCSCLGPAFGPRPWVGRVR